MTSRRDITAMSETPEREEAGVRQLSAEDREWIVHRADELFRQSERRRGGVRPATLMPQDFREYFLIDATAERIAALAQMERNDG